MESRAIFWRQNVLSALDSQSDGLREVCATNSPFPHVVVDNLFPPQLISDLVSEFPTPSDQSWDRSVVEGIQVKLRSNWTTEDDITPITAEVVNFFPTSRVVVVIVFCQVVFWMSTPTVIGTMPWASTGALTQFFT